MKSLCALMVVLVRTEGSGGEAPGNFFLLLKGNSVLFLHHFAGDCNAILSAVMSVSIWSKTALNFGLDACMRLLDASAMLRASMRISTWAALSLYIVVLLVLCGCARLDITTRSVSLSTGLVDNSEEKLPPRRGPARRAQSPSLRSP